jgi:hypothetical protein
MSLQYQHLKNLGDNSQYDNELLATICPSSTGSITEILNSHQIQDDELREDWDQARFLLERIYCRIHQIGIFDNAT